MNPAIDALVTSAITAAVQRARVCLGDVPHADDPRVKAAIDYIRGHFAETFREAQRDYADAKALGMERIALDTVKASFILLGITAWNHADPEHANVTA